MRIPFHSISPEGDPCSVQIAELFAEGELFVRKGSAAGLLRRRDDGQVEMEGELKMLAALSCDRCLTLYDWTFESSLRLLFVAPDSRNKLEDEREDRERIVLDEPYVDLAETLREQIWLALPMKRLCDGQCKGICLQCGENLNTSACHCASLSAHPALAVLEKLKKNTLLA